MDQDTCRLCNENIGVTSLFESIDAEMQLSTKVMYCAKVTIVQGDELPSFICACCEDSLAAAYRFVLKCEDTDQKLRCLQLKLKEEFETKSDLIKEELFQNDDDCMDNFGSDILDDHCDSRLNTDVKLEPDVKDNDSFGMFAPLVRTKRKYVKRSNKKRPSKKCDPIKCKICNRMISNKSTFEIHMRSHTNEKPFNCSLCDKKYKDGGTLKRHFDRNHTDGRMKSFMCEHCGKGFYTKGDCMVHMRTHTGETPYACTKCPARFTQIGSLQRHVLIHTDERSHMCSKCSKKFRTKEELKKHYMVHSDEKKYKCPICEMPFKFRNNMRKHINTHTTGITKNFTCHDCGRGFSCKGNLLSHIKGLHSTKSGFCNHCSKHVSNMEMHMYRHAGVRPIKCELCTSSFFDLKGLSTHVNFKHKSVDKFKCTHCLLKFPSKAMLDYHVMRYHEEVKPFACDMCSRCFYRKSDMVRHKKGTHKGVTELSDSKVSLNMLSQYAPDQFKSLQLIQQS